jgi:hypothetical protein
MSHSTFRFPLTLTYLEQREAPAAIVPSLKLVPTDPLTADTVLIPEIAGGTPATTRELGRAETVHENWTDPVRIASTMTSIQLPQIVTTPALAPSHGQQQFDQHTGLDEPIEDPTAGMVVPSVSGKSSNNSTEPSPATHGHIFAPPHRHPPVRVPVA